MVQDSASHLENLIWDLLFDKTKFLFAVAVVGSEASMVKWDSTEYLNTQLMNMRSTVKLVVGTGKLTAKNPFFLEKASQPASVIWSTPIDRKS